MGTSTDGIILLAKQSGISSFASLWQVKNALGTKKIGHTGTLDTFAEGLLVVLSGRLTRLVSFITDCDKEYEALVAFGTETDTLDPEGTVIKKTELPALELLAKCLAFFCGTILQQPPGYSAIHVSGQRASDRIRKGEKVDLPFRPVTIYSLDILEIYTSDGLPATAGSLISSVKLNIVCSKGTYIRSLARDIALSCHSCAHLAALRRKRIGPFFLQNAAGFSMLAPFGSVSPAKFGTGEKPPQVAAEEIKNSLKLFDDDIAPSIGLTPIYLKPAHLKDFLDGKTLFSTWFTMLTGFFGNTDDQNSKIKYAVFCGNKFIGVISCSNGSLCYEFVAGHEV